MRQSDHKTDPRKLFPQIRAGLILTVFLARYFYVTESAADGDTLWIVALWLLAGLVWAIANARSATTIISFGWLDLGATLLAAGHILSAVAVLVTSGQKRSAMNLAWEWFGAIVAWFLLRSECRQLWFRREMTFALIATGASVAGLGLYQHYIDFPRLARDYLPLFQRLNDAQPDEADAIRRKLAADQIPVEGPAFTLFKKRLGDSTEPLGFFALANSLSGLLAVCLVLAIHFGVSDIQKSGASRVWLVTAWVFVLAALGWCLLLTKSRTAWIGTVVGLGVWLLGSGRLAIHKVPLKMIAIAVLAFAVIGWGLSRIGGLDRQVITEAPKSLTYRLQYWTATWRLVLDHPWLGVGPGQFRAHYLLYKLPEASEEIADPHNLVLDAAANGGLLAVVGLTIFLLAMVVKKRPANLDTEPVVIKDGSLTTLRMVAALATLAWGVLLFTGYDDRLLAVLPVAITIAWLLRTAHNPSSGFDRFATLACRCAALCLVVHLLGAGGIGMPAIMLLLLGLTALGAEDQAIGRSESVASPIWGSICLVGLSLGALGVLYLTAIRPIAELQMRMQKGDRLLEQGRLSEADAEFAFAAMADDFSPDPWRRRSEMAFHRAEADRFRSNESFTNAVRWAQEAQLRDPASIQEDRKLGEWWLARWSLTRNSTDAQTAADCLKRAVDRYPTNAILMSELATALAAGGETVLACDAAQRALNQDSVNHQWGHVDRYLNEASKSKMERLIEGRRADDQK